MKRLERRRVLMRLTSLMLLLGCGALAGCDSDADPAPPEVVLDLTACLGSPDGDGGVSACRSSLQMMVGADGTPAGCFVVSDLAGETVRRHAIIWQSDKVKFATAGSLGFLTGQNLSVALFFGDFGDCDASELSVDTACTANDRCRHHLGPVEQFFANSGPTIIDFTRNGACVAESSAAPSADTEPCDGADNDCDGRVDEDLMEPCTTGRGACQIGGDRLRCDNGVRVCADTGGPILPPASRGPDVECDGVDTDCDGTADEEADCTCARDEECDTPALSQCVDGACRACDPSDDAGCPAETPQCLADGCHECDPADNAGCDADRPLCDADTRTCRGCATDEECTDGQVCTIAGCTACDPTRPETCPEIDRPVCDGTTYTCRRCRGEGRGDCPSGFCVDGTCGGCDPAVGAGEDGACANPSPVCDVRSQTCRGCQNDAECDPLDANRPICRDNNCVVCEPGPNTGCDDPAAPICVTEGGERRCAPCDDAAGRRCPFGACVDGRCVACDPANGNGCNVDSPLPFCDDALALGDGIGACRACEADGECPAGRLCDGGRCAECRSADGFGCDENGAAPICRGGNCVACRDDNECTTRGGDRDQCVRGECLLCDSADNQGCDAAGNTPICREGRCERCEDDGECPDGSVCLGDGRCARCEPGTNRGCPAAQPICNAAGSTCEPCDNDPECGDGRVCVAGLCRACDPGRPAVGDPLRDLGCPQDAPTCGRADFICRACEPAREADDCNGGQCVRGRCVTCDLATFDGCARDSAAPICSGQSQCVACTAQPAGCGQNGLPPTCNPDGRCVTCIEGTGQGCGGNTAFCANNQCRGCMGDFECGEGLLCAPDGSCRACLPADNRGCDPLGAAPVCDAATFTCRGCGQAPECQAIDPTRRFCVMGACLACNPANHGGCDIASATPRCVDGVCEGCGDDGFCLSRADAPGSLGTTCLDDGRCRGCDPADNTGCGGVTPLCDPAQFFCQACQAGVCPFGACAADGSCEVCDPADRGTCVLDVANPQVAGLPVCDPATGSCVACNDARDCVGHPYGPHCRGGLCACRQNGNPIRCDLFSNLPVCSGGNCIACQNADDCADNPFGARCVDGACRP